MFGHSPIESNRDRKVKVYLDNNSVSASTAQSEYARFLNFIGDRFTAVSNTVSGVKTYDIALKYADKIIPYEEGVEARLDTSTLRATISMFPALQAICIRLPLLAGSRSTLSR
jgi:hypothetical protein